MKDNPVFFQKLSILCHNFIFSNDKQLLSQRRKLKFSNLQSSSLLNEGLDPSLSQLSQYSNLYSNINKLSHNMIFKSFLNKSKQSAEKVSTELHQTQSQLKIFRSVFDGCDQDTREYLAIRYFASKRIFRFLRWRVIQRKQEDSKDNNFQIIKIGMGKRFLFQLMRQSSEVVKSVQKGLNR